MQCTKTNKACLSQCVGEDQVLQEYLFQIENFCRDFSSHTTCCTGSPLVQVGPVDKRQVVHLVMSSLECSQDLKEKCASGAAALFVQHLTRIIEHQFY